jgi:hypothetical protein
MTNDLERRPKTQRAQIYHSEDNGVRIVSIAGLLSTHLRSSMISVGHD